MSTPAIVKIVAENLADEARALAPGEGRRREVDVEEAALRNWLDNFAALPALETEDANACLHLTLPTRRIVVRRAGGRLGTEEGDTFVATTIDDIVASLLPGPTATAAAAAGAEAAAPLPTRSRARAQGWLAAALLAVFALLCWWSLVPETPEDVEWVSDSAERQTILTQAAGGYTSENERINLDSTARLSASNEAGDETLRTTVRVGRRAGGVVLVTETGVLFEVAVDGTLRLDDTIYRRGTELAATHQ